jgi:hypothetical protein
MERAKDITAYMETALETAKRALQDVREVMIKSANKKRKEVVYNPGDLVFLSSRNIKTTRPSKKLDDKMLGPFKVLKVVGTSYRLQLPVTMRIYDIFYPSPLRKATEDSLSGQMNEPPLPVVVNDEDEWEVDDILDSRLYGKGKRL